MGIFTVVPWAFLLAFLWDFYGRFYGSYMEVLWAFLWTFNGRFIISVYFGIPATTPLSIPQ